MNLKNKQQKNVLVIGGPTGVGESTITNEVIKRFPIFQRLVTATTRKPRLKEKNGQDYYFFTKNKFKQEIKQKNIIEHTFIKKTGIYYGTYKPELEKKLSSRNIIINLDWAGAKYYKKNYNATTIFIMPDSLENLKKRQLKRNPKISHEELKKRMDYAQYEIKNESPFYDYLVINKENKLNKAVNQVINIIKKDGYKIDKY